MSAQCVQLDRAAWSAAALSFGDMNYRQTWAYADAAAARVKAASELWAVKSGGETLGVCEVRVKRLPVLPAGMAYVSGGPLVRRGRDAGDDERRLGAVLGVLRRELVERRGLVLRVQAPLADDAWNGAQERAFSAAGFARSERVRTYRTALIDLAPDEAAMRKRLAQKWRNCLNKAERSAGGQGGVEIQEGSGAELFDEFTRLFDEFHAKKGFSVEMGAEFFAGVQRALPEREKLRVMIARVGGRAAAGHVSSALGDTCVYLLGATNDLARSSNAAYLLQWRAMTAAKAAGMRWYDLGGIDPNENPGVHHFKMGMGGVDATAPGPFEIVPIGWRGSATLTAERVLTRLKKTRSRSQSRATKSEGGGGETTVLAAGGSGGGRSSSKSDVDSAGDGGGDGGGGGGGGD